MQRRELVTHLLGPHPCDMILPLAGLWGSRKINGFVFTADTRAEEGHVEVATNKYMRPASSLLIRKGSSYGCHSVSTADGQPSILVLRVV